VLAFAKPTFEYSGVLVLALNGKRIYENKFAHEHKVTCIAFHSTLNIIVTGSRDTCVKFWSYNYKKDVEFNSSSFKLDEKKKIEIPPCSITSAVFHPNRPDIMATTSINGMIKLWHLIFTEEDIIINCLETIHLINHIGPSVAFHPIDNMNYLLFSSDVVKLPNGWSYSFVRDDQEKYEESTVRCINNITGESKNRIFPPETQFSGSLNLWDFSEIISKIRLPSSLTLTNTSILSSDLSQQTENDLQSTVSVKDTSPTSKLKSEKDSMQSIVCEGKTRITCPKSCKWIQNKCIKKGGVYRKHHKKSKTVIF
jgi:WD40 repeat protein